jgi:signal peptidase I
MSWSFRYPLNPSQDFIKRVIGVPGDTVVYRTSRLTVNGVPWPQKPEGTYSYLEGLRFETMSQFEETVDTGQGRKVHLAAVDTGNGVGEPRARYARFPSARTANTIPTETNSPARCRPEAIS